MAVGYGVQVNCGMDSDKPFVTAVKLLAVLGVLLLGASAAQPTGRPYGGQSAVANLSPGEVRPDDERSSS